jgi:hypothetical protein
MAFAGRHLVEYLQRMTSVAVEPWARRQALTIREPGILETLGCPDSSSLCPAATTACERGWGGTSSPPDGLLASAASAARFSSIAIIPPTLATTILRAAACMSRLLTRVSFSSP